jgi:hypothetical protein
MMGNEKPLHAVRYGRALMYGEGTACTVVLLRNKEDKIDRTCRIMWWEQDIMETLCEDLVDGSALFRIG